MANNIQYLMFGKIILRNLYYGHFIIFVMSMIISRKAFINMKYDIYV